MSQEPPEESSSLVDIMQEKQSEIASKNRQGSSSPSRHYLVVGPHSQVRTALMWVNKLLSSDETGYVSAISVRDLREALLRFQKDVRAQGFALGEVTADASRSRSSIPTNPRSPGNFPPRARGQRRTR